MDCSTLQARFSSRQQLFIIAIAIVWMTTFEIGMFGNPRISIEDRILTAQVIIISLTFCALVLGALFAERREH